MSADRPSIELATDEGAEGARAEEVRQLGARVVFAIFRLVKACALHSDNNQTVTGLVAGATDVVAELCTKGGIDALSIVFAGETVFVNGKILKGSREVYAVAVELGQTLDKLDVSEVTFERNVSRGDMTTFARIVAQTTREKVADGRLQDAGLTTIRARRVHGGASDGVNEADQSPAARAARTYATSVLIMRVFWSDLRRGDYRLPHRVKRVAQKLVSEVDEGPRLLVALAAAPSGGPDRAVTAVSTAILSLAMTRTLNSDRLTLANVAMAALLLDAGRARLSSTQAATEGMGPALSIERTLNEDELDHLPASTLLGLTAIGKLHPPALIRSVLAYEALAYRRAFRTGPVYKGRHPVSVLARIIATAQLFNDLREPVPGMPAPSIDEVLQLMSTRAKEATEKAFVRLLIGALGFFPVGTMVELNTGELAVVSGSPTFAVDFARPPVRILYGVGGALLDRPIDVDLAAEGRGRGAKARVVRRPFDADETQQQAMRGALNAAVSVARKSQDDRGRHDITAPDLQLGSSMDLSIGSALAMSLDASPAPQTAPDLSIAEMSSDLLADLTWIREARAQASSEDAQRQPVVDRNGVEIRDDARAPRRDASREDADIEIVAQEIDVGEIDVEIGAPAVESVRPPSVAPPPRTKAPSMPPPRTVETPAPPRTRQPLTRSEDATRIFRYDDEAMAKATPPPPRVIEESPVPTAVANPPVTATEPPPTTRRANVETPPARRSFPPPPRPTAARESTPHPPPGTHRPAPAARSPRGPSHVAAPTVVRAPLNERDLLLAKFLADEPIDDVPAPEPTRRDDGPKRR